MAFSIRNVYKMMALDCNFYDILLLVIRYINIIIFMYCLFPRSDRCAYSSLGHQLGTSLRELHRVVGQVRLVGLVE